MKSLSSVGVGGELVPQGARVLSTILVPTAIVCGAGGELAASVGVEGSILALVPLPEAECLVVVGVVGLAGLWSFVVLFGSLLVFFGTCADSVVFFGTCVDSLVCFGTCVNSLVFFGTGLDSLVFFGTCVDSVVFFGTCAVPFVFFGTCVAPFVLFGICVAPLVFFGTCGESVGVSRGEVPLVLPLPCAAP